jgi:hypothetical protein
MNAFLPNMNAVLTDDGKIMLSPELRESAQLQPGDTLEVQFYKGSIVLRKHQPLTPAQCVLLLERSRSQPRPTPEDDLAVEQAVRAVRAQRR